MSYVELEVTSNFSFLRGASHPEELVAQAARLGHPAIGLADRASLAGVVRAHGAAKTAGIRLLVGARIDPADGPPLLLYPTDRAAYGRLCRLITLGRRRAPKGQCFLAWRDVADQAEGQMAIVLPPERPDDGFGQALARYRATFGDRLSLAARHRLRGDDARRLFELAGLSERAGVPLVATNDVHYHLPDRRPAQDVLTCIREGWRLEEAGARLFANAERHVKGAEAMRRLFCDHPQAVARTLAIAQQCRFSLDELSYDYPIDPVPEGQTPQSELTRRAWEGAAGRYPEGVPEKVRAQIEHELRIIADLGYAPYFLTVDDLVRFARGRGILCQGRGSAANSAVCYVLGITAVDPARLDLLFERFVSRERNEPPDIDVDFEHERREEVIQYLYQKYGRERAGLAATVIAYRSRGALREVCKVLGLSADTAQALIRAAWGRGVDDITARHVRDAGLDPAAPRLRLAVHLARAIRRFPRHLSQHVGGMVMTKGRLDEVVPITNAAMEDRTVIEWDKDDLDALGILKVDILALGMLSAIRKAFALIERHHGRTLTLADVPAEDPTVYAMLSRADSLGVFQVESRAQMSMLPRLKPKTFYDLVIQVAIVRPGPIQGDMVHPYLRRRNGEEAVEFPSDALRQVLAKTLGVPIFQEQVMRVAIVAAGFSPGEADSLRRAMATFRRTGTVHRLRQRFVGGMRERGYPEDFAERCFQQIEGFAEYGFPESHAASFALLAYVSAWLKCHYPAAFAGALLNSQPMGFYAPAQIVRDARAHGVAVRPPDVNASDWDSGLEATAQGPALRLGLRLIEGLPHDEALALLAGRGDGYADPRDLWRRSGISARGLQALARADAFRDLGLERRAALWAVRGLRDRPLPLFDGAGPEPEVCLPPTPPQERTVEDYRALGLTLGDHPMAFLRARLMRQGYQPAAGLAQLANGAKVKVAGLVLVRQRPGSANGVVFVTLEDETGIANAIVWPNLFEAERTLLLGAGCLGVEGTVRREGLVVHVIARRLLALDGHLAALSPPCPILAPTTEARLERPLGRLQESYDFR